MPLSFNWLGGQYSGGLTVRLYVIKLHKYGTLPSGFSITDVDTRNVLAIKTLNVSSVINNAYTVLQVNDNCDWWSKRKIKMSVRESICCICKVDALHPLSGQLEMVINMDATLWYRV